MAAMETEAVKWLLCGWDQENQDFRTHSLPDFVSICSKTLWQSRLGQTVGKSRKTCEMHKCTMMLWGSRADNPLSIAVNPAQSPL